MCFTRLGQGKLTSVMLILSRELGESVVFEDVVLTLAKVGSRYVEVSLVKATGDKRTVVTLPHNEYVDICDDVRVIFINVNGTKV